MKKITILVYLLFISNLLTAQKTSEFQTLTAELRAIEGKYIFDEDIFEIQIVKKRLVKLLGWEVYEELEECFTTTTPFKIENEIFYFWGKSDLSHNSCNIVIDLKNNVFHVKIVYDESEEEKFFSENTELLKKLPPKYMN